MSFVLGLLSIFLEVLIICIFIRSVLSWVTPGQKNPVASVLFQITEPILAPIRRVVPRFGVADYSPLVAIVILLIVIQVLSFIG